MGLHNQMKTNIKRLAAAAAWFVAIVALVTLPLLAKPFSNPKPSARELLSAASKTAKADDKAVFVHFSASWCGWCKRLDAFLHAPEVGKLMTDNYVLLELDVQERGEKKALENPGAEELMKEMGAAEAGLPYYYFLDKNGKKLGDSLVMGAGGNIGYPAEPEEIKAFERLIEKSAPRMTAAQRAQIVSYLTKNAPRS